MAEVKLEHVRKFYDKVEVIHGVDLTVSDGEFVALVGPSGCGKSTLLRMIAGLEEISTGEIRIGGTVVNNVAPKDRDIAMVFQDYALYPHLRVADNLAFSLKQRKVDKAAVAERVAKAADILGLTEFLDRFPRQLSGGQRQRVAMGRAIVRDPQAFLFDEPLSNLDAKLRVRMRTEIKDLHQRLGATSIYVTHDQIEAMTMADRIVILRDGVVEQIGTPLELYDHPNNTFVAGFIGSPAMNFIPGRLDLTGEEPRAVVAGGTLSVMPPAAAQSDQSILLGVRPEHIRLGRDGEGLHAEVMVVEPTGHETLVVCKFGEDEVDLLLSERLQFDRGQPVWLSAEPEFVHLFDAETGRRL
ncbi:MAG: ABC transporter ATP-binding protein [Alphaproteobacteria bacterium]